MPAAPPSTAGTGTGTGHPCVLLTQAEVASSVGKPVTPGLEYVKGGIEGCSFSGDNNDGTFIGLSAWNSWDALKAHAPSGAATSVSGVGDETLFLTDAHGAQLFVRKGSAGIGLLMLGPNLDSLFGWPSAPPHPATHEPPFPW